MSLDLCIFSLLDFRLFRLRHGRSRRVGIGFGVSNDRFVRLVEQDGRGKGDDVDGFGV